MKRKNHSAWLGDSKITDKNGFPMVMYHGTSSRKSFERFDKSKIGISSGNRGFLGRGFYFTKDFWRAAAYGDVIKVFLRIEKPFIIAGILDKKTIDILNRVSDTYAFEEGVLYTHVYAGFSCSVPEYPEIADAITDGLIAEGYDGIIYGDFQEVVCFEGRQIKIIDKQKRDWCID